ncbi:TadE/TadG family type IV pilus assembly protein [Bradyrhizobium genosp. A]|uniref:TadE/TadG family type IV pilus assembly protein n=1 Tax=Bradyrhizobium genosp. A TaxID=83626 RepID=UPI003CEB9EF6
MTRLPMRLREFRADENAVAAVELAIVLPFMLLLCMGGVELGNALSINVKVTATVHTIADILSQNKCVTTTDVTGILNASSYVLSPYDITKAVVTVSEVQPTGDNVTAKVVWSQSLNGTARTTGTTVNLPTSLTGVPTTAGLILGETTYFYTPNLGYTISGTVALSDSYYLYPRQTNFVPTITSGTTPPVPGTSCPSS